MAFVYFPVGGGVAIARAMDKLAFRIVVLFFQVLDLGGFMPLVKSASEEAVKKNTAIEIAAGKEADQAYAIAKSTQREARKKKLEGRYREPMKAKK